MVMEKENIAFLKEKFPAVKLFERTQNFIELPSLLEKYINVVKILYVLVIIIISMKNYHK